MQPESPTVTDVHFPCSKRRRREHSCILIWSFSERTGGRGKQAIIPVAETDGPFRRCSPLNHKANPRLHFPHKGLHDCLDASWWQMYLDARSNLQLKGIHLNWWYCKGEPDSPLLMLLSSSIQFSLRKRGLLLCQPRSSWPCCFSPPVTAGASTFWSPITPLWHQIQVSPQPPMTAGSGWGWGGVRREEGDWQEALSPSAPSEEVMVLLLWSCWHHVVWSRENAAWALSASVLWHKMGQTNVKLRYFLHILFSMLISVVRPSRATGLLFFCFMRSPLSIQKLQSRFLAVPFCSSSLLFVFLDSSQPPKLLLLLLPWIVILLWFKADVVAAKQGCLWPVALMLADWMYPLELGSLSTLVFLTQTGKLHKWKGI